MKRRTSILETVVAETGLTVITDSGHTRVRDDATREVSTFVTHADHHDARVFHHARYCKALDESPEFAELVSRAIATIATINERMRNDRPPTHGQRRDQ